MRNIKLRFIYIITLLYLFSFSVNAQITSFSVGGFINADSRYINGDIPFKAIWDGGSFSQNVDTHKTQFSAQQSRLNGKIEHNDIKGFIEIDFVGSSQGNSIISNSYSPRLRHAYINYQDVTLGQTWSTMVNVATFPETTNLGGPLVAEAMVRQALIRYQYQDWQFALENPTTYGSRLSDGTELAQDHDAIPDVVVRRNINGDFGHISVAALLRALNPADQTQLSLGGSIAAKLPVFARNDLKLQLHYGNLGRYVGTSAAKDIVNGEIETTIAAMVAYRHFWGENWRSTFFYGQTQTQVEQNNRRHFGANLFTNLARNVILGFEVGRYQVDDEVDLAWLESPRATGAASYAQLSMQFYI